MHVDSSTPRTQRGTVLSLCRHCGIFFWSFKQAPHRPERLFCRLECAYAYRVTPLAERFWRAVEKTDGCWFWNAAKDTGGYGRIGSGPHGAKVLCATHVSWELHYGPVPPGIYVLHDCPTGDDPRCVRPDHLKLGNQPDNMRDKVAKGRQPRGEESPARKYPELMPRGEFHKNSKVNEASVREIRTRYAAGGISMAALASEYDITAPTLCNIVNGKTWRHVT